MTTKQWLLEFIDIYHDELVKSIHRLPREKYEREIYSIWEARRLVEQGPEEPTP